jgi:hypothetical protein
MMWYDHIYQRSNAYLCWGAGARCGALPDSDNRHAGSSSGSCSRRLTRLLRPSNIAVDYRPKAQNWNAEQTSGLMCSPLSAWHLT